MERNNLWAPWRLDYIQSVGSDAGASHKSAGDCFMCQAVGAAEADHADHLVLLHDHRGVMMLNRYPYTNGHLLIVPSGHRGRLNDLTEKEREGLMGLVALGEQLLEAAMNPQGINVGINIGEASGAGVPGHLHIHVLPRWHGDTNFMSSVAGLRVIPQALEKSYEQLGQMLKGLI